jgi:hypothetical protein
MQRFVWKRVSRLANREKIREEGRCFRSFLIWKANNFGALPSFFVAVNLE